MQRLKNSLREEKAQEIAEAAIVLPLFFLFLGAILWFGRAFNIYATVNRAAREAAQAAAAPTCGSCGNAFSNATAIQNNVVSPVLRAAHLDPTLVKNFALNNVVLNPSSTPTVNGVSVSLGYPYNFTLNGVTCCPFALKPIATNITITAKAEACKEE
jgi:hypothetical protein